MNPFKWMLSQYERLGDLEAVSLVLYCVAVLIAGAVTGSYEDLASIIALALVGFVLSIPGSLAIGALLKALAQIYDAFFSSRGR